MDKITHIAGSFIIQAEGAFLNGAGLSDGEDRNTTIPKSLKVGKESYPYVSAQSWRRWLRNTVCQEENWPVSELRGIAASAKETTSKISGELNPIDYPEDDIFGYMCSASGQGKKKKSNEEDAEEEEEEKTNSKVKSIIRTSPFMSSILISIRNKCISKDEGFVHLKEGTPLPYSTQFYYTDLQGVFCLDYSRLGTFSNIGDRIELDERLINHPKIEKTDENVNIFKIKDNLIIKKERASAILKALAVLRGGAKQAAFGTDVSPKVIVAAGLSSGNPIFNSLFTEDGTDVVINIDLLKELAEDYKDKLKTKIYIGIRNGYLKNEEDLKDLDNNIFIVTTPIKAMAELSENL